MGNPDMGPTVGSPPKRRPPGGPLSSCSGIAARPGCKVRCPLKGPLRDIGPYVRAIQGPYEAVLEHGNMDV